MDNYAGFWRRFAAYLIDTIIMYIVAIPVFAIGGAGSAGMMMTGTSEMSGMGPLFWIMYLAYILINVLYFVLLESSAKQATLGKMALGIIVTDENGNRISKARATGRFFGKILSGVILLIGYIMAAFTARKQALHDMLASTLVLRARPGEVGVDPGVFA